MSEKSTLERLLAMDIAQPEEKQLKIKRLSAQSGDDVVFTIRELSYNRVSEIQKQSGDTSVHIVLAGVCDPDFKDKTLMEKYNAVTPAELVKKLLRPGEVEDLSREIQRLSGYLSDTVEDIKKK